LLLGPLMAVKQSHTFFLHNVISTNTRKMSRDGTRRHMLLLIVLRKNRSYGEIRMSDEFESVGEGLRSRSLLADHGTSGPVRVGSGPHHVPYGSSWWPRPLYRPSCIMVSEASASHYYRHFPLYPCFFLHPAVGVSESAHAIRYVQSPYRH